MRPLLNSLVLAVVLAITNWRGRCVYAFLAFSLALLYAGHARFQAVWLLLQLTHFFVPFGCLLRHAFSSPCS
jgi:hypothetical protein